MQHANQHHGGGIIGAVVGILALLFGATGTFAALQQALNRTWQVKSDPSAGGIRYFTGKRLLSVGMILGIGFLLLVSLALSTAITAFGGWAAEFLPAFLSGPLLHILGSTASFIIITPLFAAMFKVPPDQHRMAAGVDWSCHHRGAVYGWQGGDRLLPRQERHGECVRRPGSLVVIVLWVYYASLILLIGAEFTQVWAAAHGHAIQPQKGAARVVREERQAEAPKRAS